jgi:phosphatidate phosphatase APP1
VFVNGVPNNSNEEIFSPVQTEEQQNIPTTNLSETNAIDGTQTEEQQNIPTTNLSETNDIDNVNNALLVTIFPQKNPVARGDSQNTTITVTDSASGPVANAEISGNLVYPGDNYEKEFTGITDAQGKFVYSWIIGENGDVGPLSIEVQVSSQGYPSASATSSFEIVDSSEASGINNDLDDPFD